MFVIARRITVPVTIRLESRGFNRPPLYGLTTKAFPTCRYSAAARASISPYIRKRSMSTAGPSKGEPSAAGTSDDALMQYTASEHSLWWQNSKVPRISYPQLSTDMDVDVCVVGGGLFGTLTAFALNRRFSGQKVWWLPARVRMRLTLASAAQNRLSAAASAWSPVRRLTWRGPNFYVIGLFSLAPKTTILVLHTVTPHCRLPRRLSCSRPGSSALGRRVVRLGRYRLSIAATMPRSRMCYAITFHNSESDLCIA